jgi:hypothetical protein
MSLNISTDDQGFMLSEAELTQLLDVLDDQTDDAQSDEEFEESECGLALLEANLWNPKESEVAFVLSTTSYF